MTRKHLKTSCFQVSVCAGICEGVTYRRGDCTRVVCIMKMQIFTLEVWGLQRSSVPRTRSAGRWVGAGGWAQIEACSPGSCLQGGASQPLTHNSKLPSPSPSSVHPGTGLSLDTLRDHLKRLRPLRLGARVAPWDGADMGQM